MLKTTLTVEGMACGMCEAHVNDVIRKNFEIKKVSSSHKKGLTEIVSEKELDEAKLRSAIEGTGYNVITVCTEPYEKKRLLRH